MAGLDSAKTRELRTRIVEALESDLIGPISCDPHEVLKRQPSQVYGLGVLASTNEAAELDAELDEARSDDPADAGESDDDTEPAGTPRRFTPSSMGMTFLLAPGSDELAVELTWGDYEMATVELEGSDAEPSELAIRPPAGGRPKFTTQWRRRPRNEHVRLTIARPTVLGESTQGRSPVSASEPNLRLGWQAALVPAALGYPRGTTTVSVFVVNERLLLVGSTQGSDAQRRDAARMFQTCLDIRPAAAIVPMRDPRGTRLADQSTDDRIVASETRLLALQYRAHKVWGSGHNCAVLGLATDGRRVEDTEPAMLRTEVMPWHDVPATQSQEFKHRGGDLVLDMDELGALSSSGGAKGALAGLTEISHDWAKWLGRQESTVVGAEHQAAKEALSAEISSAIKSYQYGYDLLSDDPMARQAFIAMNQAMGRARRGHGLRRAGEPALWRPFQMAFIVCNLQSIVDPTHTDRQRAELLFMPTGGGKTEAYLGLIAFTLFFRRLREAAQPGGGAGVAVILRYTLRLLTLDQLERATRLICAMELMRKEAIATDTNPWGDEPFGVGLWVGRSATDNTLKDFFQAQGNQRESIPLARCPWCNGQKKLAAHKRTSSARSSSISMDLLCGNRGCVFEEEPLPIHFVDEEVYTRVPSLLIGTIDKFAMVPWREQSGAIFGRTAGAVRAHSGRSTHLRWQPMSAERKALDVVTATGLTPPELIIQDELHLIAGPLGTIAAWYEAAFDVLMSTRADGTSIPAPKIVTATATARGARSQVRTLFGRADARQFPPPGIDAGDVFFVRPDNSQPGRRYLGLAHTTRPYKALQLQLYVALLQAVQKLAGDTRPGQAREFDQFTTILGYFNSLRELGGMRRVAESDLRQRAKTARTKVCDSTPYFAIRNYDKQVEELTSRESTESITRTKQWLDEPWGAPNHLDVALSTNMISVGVDIQRLGLMVMAGPPKTISEYIQASSRVGRSDGAAGLVIVAYNLARARDRSHYEHFHALHGQFYREVEAVSVTPFAPQAQSRTFEAVVVTLIRHGISTMSEHSNYSRIDSQQHLDSLKSALITRLQAADAVDSDCRRIESAWESALGQWKNYSELAGDAFQYGNVFNTKGAPNLLNVSRKEANKRKGLTTGFVIGTSMRDVEPACTIIMNEQRETN
jgi:hypothetical protein